MILHKLFGVIMLLLIFSVSPIVGACCDKLNQCDQTMKKIQCPNGLFKATIQKCGGLGKNCVCSAPNPC